MSLKFFKRVFGNLLLKAASGLFLGLCLPLAGASKASPSAGRDAAPAIQQSPLIDLPSSSANEGIKNEETLPQKQSAGSSLELGKNNNDILPAQRPMQDSINENLSFSNETAFEPKKRFHLNFKAGLGVSYSPIGIGMAGALLELESSIYDNLKLLTQFGGGSAVWLAFELEEGELNYDPYIMGAIGLRYDNIWTGSIIGGAVYSSYIYDHHQSLSPVFAISGGRWVRLPSINIHLELNLAHVTKTFTYVALSLSFPLFSF